MLVPMLVERKQHRERSGPVTPLKTKADAEALVNQEGIEYVSVRFTDLIGVQQHFTVPASEFLKDAFDEGMPFDGSSIEVSRPSTNPI